MNLFLMQESPDYRFKNQNLVILNQLHAHILLTKEYYFLINLNEVCNTFHLNHLTFEENLLYLGLFFRDHCKDIWRMEIIYFLVQKSILSLKKT